jgi:hypothetical protein
MDRRDFLKAVGVGSGAAIAATALPIFEGFKPQKNYNTKDPKSAGANISTLYIDSLLGITIRRSRHISREGYPRNAHEGWSFVDLDTETMVVFDGEQWCQMQPVDGKILEYFDGALDGDKIALLPTTEKGK